MKRSFVSMVSVLMLCTVCLQAEDVFTQRSWEAAASQVKGLVISVRDRIVEVSQSEDDLLHIAYAESSREGYDLSLSDEGILTMVRADNKRLLDYFGGKPSTEARRIQIRLPQSGIGSLTISTTNESVQLSSVRIYDNIRLSVNGGDLVFDALSPAASIDLSAKNGNISGTIAGSFDEYAVMSSVKKGKSNLPEEKRGGEKEARFSANNGDISVDFIGGVAYTRSSSYTSTPLVGQVMGIFRSALLE